MAIRTITTKFGDGTTAEKQVEFEPVPAKYPSHMPEGKEYRPVQNARGEEAEGVLLCEGETHVFLMLDKRAFYGPTGSGKGKRIASTLGNVRTKGGEILSVNYSKSAK